MAFDTHQNETEIAWAAGLFEGEGCIVVSPVPRGTFRVALTLGTTDCDVLHRFIAVVGAGGYRVSRGRKANHREFYVWTMHSRRAKPVLEMLLPWLGERRSAKAREALDAIAALKVANKSKTHCPKGHEYTTENTRICGGSRQCRACGRVPCRSPRLRSKVA